MMILPTKRRLFITENSKDFFKLFSVGQGSSDADIYFTWPDLEKTNFFLLDNWNPERERDEFRQLSSINKGRLSFHASGQAHFAEDGHKARKEFVVKGNQIYNAERNETGVRHLFTGFLTNPAKRPQENSPAFNRISDDSFLTKNLAPAIIIFFAVPNSCSVKFEMTLNTDHFKVPDHLPGIGNFMMKHHSLFWVAYQQIHLGWPTENYIAYSDGHCVPLFIAKEDNKMDLIFTKPEYEVSKQILTIKINQEQGVIRNQL